MKLTQTLIALAIVSMSLPSMATDSLATVNGKPIKQSLLDYIIRDAASHGQKIDDNTKQIIVNKLVGTELVFQEAQRAGFDKQADFLARNELAHRELLVNTYLQDYLKKNPITEADTKAAYEQFKKELGDKEYSARHILVKTEAEAKDIIEQLQKGGDFAKIAKDKSLDTVSKEKGGDLGWFSPAGMVKPFSEALVALTKGKSTTTPVQTQFGWHIIKLDDTRATQAPAYDKVKDGLEKTLQQRKLEKMMTDLRSKAKIVNSAN